jgi:hypothetical protein
MLGNGFNSESSGKPGRETDMDTSFTIKPRPGVEKFPRDPLPGRKTVNTELDAAKAVAAVGDGDNEPRERRQEHAPHDLIADPETREVINRENDVSAQSVTREHPDQALARLRAYRPAAAEPDHPSPAGETHANIKA